jgi:hypothetical protein
LAAVAAAGLTWVVAVAVGAMSVLSQLKTLAAVWTLLPRCSQLLAPSALRWALVGQVQPRIQTQAQKAAILFLGRSPPLVVAAANPEAQALATRLVDRAVVLHTPTTPQVLAHLLKALMAAQGRLGSVTLVEVVLAR